MNFTIRKYASLEVYILCRFLGRGAFSKVKLGFNTITKQYHAIKIIKHNNNKNHNPDYERKEAAILNHIQHPNAVQLIKYIEKSDYVKKNGTSYPVTAMILEYLPGPQLYQYISVSGRLHERMARTLFHKLINVLEHCHSNRGITHRDVKPENIMFTPHNFDLKLVDFGVSDLIVGRNGNGQLHSIAGSRAYMAPEIHLGVPYNGACVDLFSAGVTLFIMVSGIRPFAKADRNDTYYHLLVTNRQDTFWAAHERLLVEYGMNDNGRFYSEEFKSLMNSMLAFDPTMRLTLPEVKAHPWYCGEIADDEEIRAEFMLRKKETERAVQATRDQQKQIKKLQALL